MTDLNALSDEAFRAEVRRFVEAEYPPELRHPPHRLHWEQGRPWFDKLQARGWVAPGWPREHGGLGLDAGKQIILIEEYERHGVARLPDHGVIMLGPLLIRFGTQEQQERFLPRILAGEDIWCQGYSEPGAGSDLASLRTEAVPGTDQEGDHYVVNGQKIWTTLATDANWIFCLVRTDKGGKKQEGISFLLIDMRSPGVTVRPIINLARHDEFCEVFFDNVRVPRENLVGEPNKGWSMAKALLGFERIFLGSPRQSGYALARLKLLAERMGVFDEPDFQDRYTRLRMDLDDHKDLYETFVAVLRRGDTLGPDVSMLKLHQAELFQRITELMLEIAGENAGLLEPMGGNRDLHPAGQFIEARPTTIYGGSSEIQRGILAKNVLGLPG
ncbi:acyl-CoA dehydrogenase family protein [Teichococcus vastitatis]|uniref:Acyl-CoA dehydrogenase family protein n=1 Tax=Teichococcus vastitatis TaxID=2307076 RepID=A0ABS9WAD1_9PROT|nr:acyl-CoA dehydrogenase family protein [Pseudoroseomonas vastitatis]